MNIGSIKQNEAGTYIGKIATLALAMTIALRPVHSTNPKAPKYEVMALSQARTWVKVGALFELFATNTTGAAFLNGKLEDPSFAAPLYISMFQQDDGSYNVVWNRPNRRRDVTAEIAAKTDDSLPPLPGEGDGEAPVQKTETGLGQSSAEHAFGGDAGDANRGKRKQRTADAANPAEPADAAA